MPVRLFPLPAPSALTCLIAATLPLLACGASKEPAQASMPAEDSTTATVRSAIHAAWARHIAGALQRDVSAVSEIYAPNAVYSVGGIEIRGRPALDSMEARTLAAMTVIDAQHTTSDLQLSGDTAYELGTIVGPVQPQGDTTRVLSFHFMAQWRKQADGNWRLTYLVGQ